MRPSGKHDTCTPPPREKKEKEMRRRERIKFKCFSKEKNEQHRINSDEKGSESRRLKGERLNFSFALVVHIY